MVNFSDGVYPDNINWKTVNTTGLLVMYRAGGVRTWPNDVVILIVKKEGHWF